MEECNTILETRKLCINYGDLRVVKGIDLQVPSHQVTAVIGPSGCGKSSMLRVFNRMNDFIPTAWVEGEVLFHGENLYDKKVDPGLIRQKIGMVFQRPNPFPKSIFKNVVWGPKINGYKGNLNDLAEEALRKAALWDEVKDRLRDSALKLSGGQQQRLCIARAIAMNPEVILMDEPCSALDPRATARIEDLIQELRSRYTIVIVTHNMQQAARISDLTAFLYEGDLVEFGSTKKIFTQPDQKRTEDYITGRFG
ncbi:phosphate ABC transporter ATP-binding protein PstB [Nitrospina sp. 32_T5]|uniref:phosphate ABC transporter ATP-binding protein PstB n=1 Tax=unclassified Nitrospina TaxID=2638683 RepID=UPI003F99627F